MEAGEPSRRGGAGPPGPDPDAQAAPPRPGRGGAHRPPGLDTVLIPRVSALSGRHRSYLFYAIVLLGLALVAGIGVVLAGHGWGPPPADRPGANGAFGAGPGGGIGAGDLPDPGASATPSPSRASPGASRSAASSPPRSASPAPATLTPSPSRSGTAGAPAWTSLTVNATKALFRGDSVQTNRTRLVMQADGNLAIIDETGRTRWTSGTAGPGYQATFQSDGNFVVYDASARPLWSSRTDGHDGAVLVLQTNGDVCVVYQGASIWCAGTAH